MTKNKPAAHVKPGDTIVFTSQVSGVKTEDTVTKVTVDDMTGDVSMFFPPNFIVLQSGERMQRNPETYVVVAGNKQVEYVA